MDPRLRPKSDLYIFAGYILLLLAILVNPLALSFWQAKGILPPVPAHHFHQSDLKYILPVLLDVFLITTGAIIIWAPKRLGYYLNESFIFNLFMFSILLAIMFSLNVIQPGKYKLLRILYILGLLFLLANTLFQAVVKKRDGSEVHPFYKNLALVLFSIFFLLIFLEGVFMFHQSTHRFNGTLGSRAWFLNHWTLNEEGYRDAPYDSASVNGKRKILVIGDSFVAGHGVKDVQNRFTNQLEAMIPGNEFRVYNLGVGGSDTRDENKRLREFPYKPDLLIFSWYPNDIEADGELGGLILQHAQSYHDVWGPARFFARRSYLWNYLYWRYPHPDELSDYFGYIKQCFAYLKVRYAHFHEIDHLVEYGDSLQVPMAAVVFPFLENAEGSQFATDPIEGRFRGQGVPTISVRDMLLGKPASDYIVNQNDPHPNEVLHKLVADSLFALLSRMNAFAGGPNVGAPQVQIAPAPKTSPPAISAPKPAAKVPDAAPVDQEAPAVPKAKPKSSGNNPQPEKPKPRSAMDPAPKPVTIDLAPAPDTKEPAKQPDSKPATKEPAAKQPKTGGGNELKPTPTATTPSAPVIIPQTPPKEEAGG